MQEGGCVLVQPLSVARAREESRYTLEKTDPRDADLIAELVTHGRFTDTRLPASRAEDSLWQLAREYFRSRAMAAAERTRLGNFWHPMLPQLFSILKHPAPPPRASRRPPWLPPRTPADGPHAPGWRAFAGRPPGAGPSAAELPLCYR